MVALLKRPSAFVPLLISGSLLALLLAKIAQGTLLRQPDEDAAAHLFQLLMPLQLIIIIVFAATWLPKSRKPALEVLALQVGAALAVLAVVYFHHL